MIRNAALSASLLLAGCGATLSSTISGTTRTPSAVLFECVTQKVDSLGYEKFRVDRRALRLVSRKADETVQQADRKFLKGVDELTVDVVWGDAEAANTLSVTARSYHEYFDDRGRTLKERRVSAAARDAARQVLETCTAETP